MSHANLDGKVVAIAGAAGGLGPDVAKLLARRGATLALGERDGDRLDQVVADLDLPDDKVAKRVVDLLSLDDARAWADEIRGQFGKVDALVHLVGGWRGGKPIGECGRCNSRPGRSFRRSRTPRGGS
jgi:NAD(P)-dependent dehydrogenase (short-subunit alcohol dehydrogenase family)